MTHNPLKPTENPIKNAPNTALFNSTEVFTPCEISKIAEIIELKSGWEESKGISCITEINIENRIVYEQIKINALAVVDNDLEKLEKKLVAFL